MDKYGRDYITNEPSYYDYLAKLQKQIEKMVERIDQYDEELADKLQEINNRLDYYMEEWDKNLEEFPESVVKLLNEWLEDGTLENIINSRLLGMPLNIYQFQSDVVTDTQGRDDWTTALENALQQSSNILLPPIDNFYIRDVVIPDDTTIQGYAGQTVIKGFFHDDIGNYTDTIFHVNNVQNVTFKNLIFDGDLTYSGYTSTMDRDKVTNLITVNQSENVMFNSCHYRNFVSNTLPPDERTNDEFSVTWSILAIKHSQDVYLLDNQLYNAHLEGITFYDVQNAHVDNLLSQNTKLSTPLHFWYCDGFKLINSHIHEDINRDGGDAGSTINLYSKNGVVSGNRFIGGTSFDIGNEAENPNFYEFVQENVVIENNIIEGCINAFGTAKDWQLNKDMVISHNTINADGYTRSISTGNSENVSVENNVIKNGTNGFRISGSNINNLNINGNHFENINKPIALVPKTHNTMTSIQVKDNYLQSSYNEDYNGSGSFVMIGQVGDFNGSVVVENIVIENNYLNMLGAIYHVYPDSNETMHTIENVILRDNVMTVYDGTVNTRMIYPVHTKNLVIDNNDFHNGNGQKVDIDKVENIYLINNRYHVYDNGSEPDEVWFMRDGVIGMKYLEGNKVIGDLSNIINHFRLEFGAEVNPRRTINNYPDTYSDELRPTHFGMTPYRPPDATVGHQYFDTDLGQLIVFDGSDWVDSQGNNV